MSADNAMRIFFQVCLVGMLLVNACLAFSQNPSKVVGSYTYRYSDREGRPSKCDCDYYEEQIDLHEDGTFLYMEQRGRLDAKQQWEKGTWSMRNDSVVELVGTHSKGSIYGLLDQKTPLDKWREEANHHSFVYDRYRLFTWGRDKKYD
jgi:hypothetical protein